MTRPVDIRIGRLVLPASERGRGEAFHAALERSLGARLHGSEPTPGGESAADRAAQAIAQRIRGSEG